MIIAQLRSDYQQISLINRAQLLDDSLNIARTNALPYAIPLALTQYLTEEQDYIPWKSALNGLSYLDLMYIRTTGYGEFKVRLIVSLILHDCNASLIESCAELPDEIGDTTLRLRGVQRHRGRFSPTHLHASHSCYLGLQARHR